MVKLLATACQNPGMVRKSTGVHVESHTFIKTVYTPVYVLTGLFVCLCFVWFNCSFSSLFLFPLLFTIVTTTHSSLLHTMQGEGDGVHEPEEEIGRSIVSIITKCISKSGWKDWA